MSEIVDLQCSTEPESPDEEKASNVSYVACRNSFHSQAWCWRW